MTTVQERTTSTPILTDRVLLVTCDSHIGPSMEQLRPYCEQAHLEAFDGFAASVDAPKRGEKLQVPHDQVDRGYAVQHRQAVIENALASGSEDHEGRLRDTEADGIVAEVIFHNTLNGQPLPFTTNFALHTVANDDTELANAGLRIYNRWLADFCAQLPDRRAGMAQIPAWDPEACVREVIWAKEAGLRGVNFPVIRPHDESVPLYTDPVWEPFFATCESLDLPLVTHSSGLDQFAASRYRGIGHYAMQFAYGCANSRHTAWWLIFSGVFERYPNLRYALTELHGVGDWVISDLHYMDSVYQMDAQRELREVIRKSPSEYFHTQIYLGASMMSNHEVHRLGDELGIENTLMWGSDYPHKEGTWPYTNLALRKTFHDVAPERIQKFCGDNAIALYGFDPAKLRPIADRIGPTFDEIAQPFVGKPEGLQYSFSFREDGAFT